MTHEHDRPEGAHHPHSEEQTSAGAVEGPPSTVEEFWQARYGDQGPIWSGRPNESVVAVLSDLAPGRAVDLGSGEGADAIWLAQRGWDVTGIDVSATAAARAAVAADGLELAGRVRFEVADLATWRPEGDLDLVTASFFHSPVELPRTDILRRAGAALVAGGHLLIVSHAAFPPWSSGPERHAPHDFLSPEQEIRELGLPEADWTVVRAETRTRQATGPNGESAPLDDGVVLLRRN